MLEFIKRGITFEDIRSTDDKCIGVRLDGVDDGGRHFHLRLNGTESRKLVDLIQEAFEPDEDEKTVLIPESDSVLSKVISWLPDATVGEDSEGQLVINTGIYSKS